MAGNYKVSEISVDESQAFLRVVTLSSSGVKYDTLAVSLDRRFPGKSEASGISPMNEIYLPLDTPTIETIDGDSDKQEAFLRGHSRLVDGNRVNVCFVNYRLQPGEKPKPENVAFLNDLLLWSRNHIYVLPTISFQKSDTRPPEDRVGVYDKLVGQMLELKNQTVPGKLRAGIMIPSFYPRQALDGLVGLFDDEDSAPGFVAIDYSNAKFSTPAIEQKIMFVHRLFRKQKEEEYFVYGLRVRLRRKGPPPGCAEDLTSLLSGLNAIGRPHRDTPIKMMFPPFAWDSMIAFHPSRYAYDRLLIEKSTREAFEDYLNAQYIDVPDLGKPAKPEDKRYSVHASNFARRSLNVEGSQIAKEVRGSDSKAIKKRLAGKEASARAKSLQSKL